MNQINTFSNMILKAGFSYLHIEAVTLFHGINQHATMMVRVSIEQETANQLINRSFANGVLSLNNQETKEVLFAGMIDQIQVKMENQVWQAELQVVSLTQKMDIEKKQRSFQNQQLSYQAIFSEVIKNHKNSQFINVNGLEQPRNGLVLQYDETDWELLMRLAGRNQTFLIPDIAEARPRFWIGNKLGKRINLPATKYKINKAYQEYKDIQENFIETLHMEDFYQLTFKTTERAELGDYVNHENTVYSIIEKRAQTNGAVLYFDYLAIPRNLIKYWKYPSNRNIGLTIEGKVLAVQGHMVKVHLDIDQHQNKNQAVWLPYVTEGSNMTYYMPEIGSKVKVYFPKAEEQQVMVTQGVRTKKDLYRSQMSDPTTKILSNLQGKKISLEPDNLNILSQDGLSITLTDNSNIAISSPSAINMHSSSDISLSSHQSISISGDQGVVLQGKNTSSISISSDIQLSSPDLQYTGGSGAKASHKSLEGNNKNQRQKRSTQSIPIQQLDSIGFIQKAVSSLPAVSATKHDNQG